ncbi:MAG: hypothetical protein CHKLHMKO_00654 [Candidatus Argoarchaeum ethanivorans]|uniref:Uncharacterized protein n=1 Tax=Candidatus Argoarchaeum ethanivorans TaxID=2608793 RepID=A0A811TES1_9EURY|nr:MAG: hypothetical protein CHKLHMKO_00654 [Candidatus Argoarchaeum ethanivorans]
MPENKETDSVEGEFSIGDKIKVKFRGTCGAKAVIIGLITLIYLYHVCFRLNSAFIESTSAFIMSFLFFSLIWLFGCSDVTLQLPASQECISNHV